VTTACSSAQSSPTLAPRLSDDRDHVGRLAGLRDPDHERAVEARRLLVQREERRRREPQPARGRRARAGTAHSARRSRSCARGDKDVTARRRAGRARAPAPRSRAASRSAAREPRAVSKLLLEVRSHESTSRHRGRATRGCRRTPRRSRGRDSAARPEARSSTTIIPSTIGGRLHPRVPVCVADDDHVRGRNRLALAHDRAQPVLRLAGSDVRDRPQLDDARRVVERYIAFDLERAPRRNGRSPRDPPCSQQARAQAASLGDATGRLAQPRLVDGCDERRLDLRDPRPCAGRARSTRRRSRLRVPAPPPARRRTTR